MKDFFKKWYFNTMHYITSKVAAITTKIYIPFSRQRITYTDINNFQNNIQYGDLIVTATKSELTYSIIPGLFKHIAVYTGHNNAVEAVLPKIVETKALNIILPCTYYAILRPVIPFSQREQHIFVEEAKKFIGVPYDKSMQFERPDKVSCSELVYHAMKKVRPELLTLRKRFGIPTITPNDFFEATTKFNVIITNYKTKKQYDK